MIYKIERELFLYGLVIAIVHHVFQLAWKSIQTPSLTLAIHGGFILFSLMLFLVARRIKRTHILAFLFHVALLPVFIYFWKVSNGYFGSVPLFFCIYVAFVICTCHGWTLVASLLLYTFVILGLIYMPTVFEASHLKSTAISETKNTIDFLIALVMVMLFVSQLKNKFNFYREEIALQNSQLQNVATQLHDHNEEISLQHEEVKAINENLETIIMERMREIEMKNKALSEYAFINAHLLRAPLSRVLGLIYLMQTEADANVGQLNQIKTNARQVDEIIKQINATIE